MEPWTPRMGPGALAEGAREGEDASVLDLTVHGLQRLLVFQATSRCRCKVHILHGAHSSAGLLLSLPPCAPDVGFPAGPRLGVGDGSEKGRKRTGPGIWR